MQHRHLGEVMGLAEQWERSGETRGLGATPPPVLEAAVGGCSFVAVEAESVVGFVWGTARCNDGSLSALLPDGEPYVEIEELYVVPERRSRGIGRRLVEAVRNWSERSGHGVLSVYSATRDVERVGRFYRSCGFESWSTRFFRDLRAGRPSRARRQALPRPDAILFDAGGTLLELTRWDPLAGSRAVLRLATSARAVTPEQINDAARRLDAELYPRREASLLELPPWAVQRLVYERLGLVFTASPDRLEATFLDAARAWSPTPGIHAALEQLAGLGIRAAVVSNSAFSSEALRRDFETHELVTFFEFTMSSADYVVRKPHPLLFETAASKLGVSPDRIWYVGDSEHHDVDGAHAANMVAILYRPSREPEPTTAADATIREWSELIALVRLSSRE